MREDFVGIFCVLFSVAYMNYLFRCFRNGEIKHHGYTYSKIESKFIFYSMLCFMGLLGISLFSIGMILIVIVINDGTLLERGQAGQL